MRSAVIYRQDAINALGDEPELWEDPYSLSEDYSKGQREQWNDDREVLLNLPPADVRPVPPTGIGDMSDGYHTFNQLYYQRMMLFATIVKQNKESAWKSLRHEDGELCFGGGWFAVGIDTPEGSYTYHYECKDWDIFDCVELECCKHWDGHTEKDVTRLLSLPEDVQPEITLESAIDYLLSIGWMQDHDKQMYEMGMAHADVQPVVHGEWIPVTGVDRASKIFPYTERVWVDATEPDEIDAVKCSVCGEVFEFADARNWCTECGAKNKQRSKQ